MKKLAVAAILVLVSTALADYSFPAFNLANVPSGDGFAVPLPGAPADVYWGFTVTTNWSAVSGNPWSSEARVGFYDVYPAPALTYYSPAGPTSGGASNGNPAFLTWNAGFTQPFTGGALPFTFRAYQSYTGSLANWNDITVTLKPGVMPTTYTDLGIIDGPLTVTGTLASGEIKWYRFEIFEDVIAPDTFFDIDTEGSTITGPDTELGLFDNSGYLKGTDDDDGTGLLSQLTFGNGSGNPPPGDGQPYNGRDGNLTKGVYWLAFGGYNMNFGGGWNVTTNSTRTGDYMINFNTNVVPEPAALALLALGLLIRRR
jgi:hypothetical protein